MYNELYNRLRNGSTTNRTLCDKSATNQQDIDSPQQRLDACNQSSTNPQQIYSKSNSCTTSPQHSTKSYSLLYDEYKTNPQLIERVEFAPCDVRDATLSSSLTSRASRHRDVTSVTLIARRSVGGVIVVICDAAARRLSSRRRLNVGRSQLCERRRRAHCTCTTRRKPSRYDFSLVHVASDLHLSYKKDHTYYLRYLMGCRSSKACYHIHHTSRFQGLSSGNFQEYI